MVKVEKTYLNVFEVRNQSLGIAFVERYMLEPGHFGKEIEYDAGGMEAGKTGHNLHFYNFGQIAIA
jgi:hypothetical protein